MKENEIKKLLGYLIPYMCLENESKENRRNCNYYKRKNKMYY